MTPRFRVTVRGTDVELRGYVDGAELLDALAVAIGGVGDQYEDPMIVASPAADDYDPFRVRTEPEGDDA